MRVAHEQFFFIGWVDPVDFYHLVARIVQNLNGTLIVAGGFAWSGASGEAGRAQETHGNDESHQEERRETSRIVAAADHLRYFLRYLESLESTGKQKRDPDRGSTK